MRPWLYLLVADYAKPRSLKLGRKLSLHFLSREKKMKILENDHCINNSSPYDLTDDPTDYG
jgi:hypothetical protein